jgi:mono/diheme cytochrome c family protein
MKSRFHALAVTVVVAALTVPVPGASQQAVTYTAEQAASGAVAYEEHCSGCHLSTMAGSFEAPQLAGPNFLTFWGGEPITDLLEMTSYMPPDEEGSLGDEMYASIVAYILSRNGFPMGGEALTMASNDLLTGGTGVALTAAGPAGGRGGGGGG